MAEIVGTVVLGVSVNFVLEKALALAKATDCHRFYFRCRMAPKFQDIIIKLEDINKQANEFALQYRMSEPHFSTAGTSVNNNHETDSFVAPYVVVRPDDDDDWIVL
ncbi:OLC1v1015178C1 [Oldenlandia corymbosa var. corymbosa]|uniref:OLC1v1015178C1 n=1 Tax=Oldenlandia corymbosa var. corymbosa TaxID=529605 RepID=A0AAV1E4U3_OLDCO|nr:OLC1v1015178C1 [Oldenlandia corymbosa var. corymbosa]